jgi:hypothetical protein
VCAIIYEDSYNVNTPLLYGLNFICFVLQICSFLAGLFHSKLIKRALVVAPKTLLSHWIKELSVVGLSAKTRE